MSVSGEAWGNEDSQEREPKFGRRAHRWFKRRLEYELSRERVPDNFEALLTWFAEEARQYVKWEPAEFYRGAGFSAGTWELNMPAVLHDLGDAIIDVRRQAARAAAPAFQSLDEWLAADRAGAIPAQAYQVGGSAGLREPQRQALARAKAWRDLVRPRECPDCHGTWRVRTVQWKVGGVGIAGHDREAKRCHACRKAGRKTKLKAGR